MSTTFDQVFQAVSEGNIEFLRSIDLRPFIDHEQDDPDDEGISTLLCTACVRGHLNIVELLLNVDGVDVNKDGPLFCACEIGHVEIVKLLLSVDGIDVNQYRALAVACEKGYSEIVKLLLDFDGVDVDAYNALYRACYEGNYEIVKLLLAKNARIGEEERKEYDTNIKPKGPLSWACLNGHSEIVKLLLDVDGIDVNDGSLSTACVSGHSEIVKLLLNVDGIDVNDGDVLAWTCLNGHSEIVKLLLDVDGIDVNKGYPFFEACFAEQEQSEIVKLLLAKNVEIKGKERRAYDVNIKPILGDEWDLDRLKDFIQSEEKFKLFARQNSILLLNTQFSNYANIQTLHTGLSVVYKATKSNNQVVILKEISLTGNNCETVMNEIMNLVILKGHSRIIKLNGVFIESQFNKVYIETPYYSNGNLLEYINKIRNYHDLPTLKTMLRTMFRKITETLQFIHSKDILHRDLKPHNILVNENGEPIIADFGSSKKLIAQLTNNTMGVGTLKYMAPEVKRQVEAPSEKSDIWSLGVSLYECWKLIQQTSMIDNTTVEILNFDLNGNVKLPIENQQDDIDITLMKMLSHMFEINPRDRPTVLSLLTDEDYFTHENLISVDILSKANQKVDSSDKLSLWQIRLKKLKEIVLMLSEHRRGEIKFEINRQNLLQGISEIVDNKMTQNNKYLIFYKTFVTYLGESGIDQGGLSNDLYSKYVEAMLIESKHFQKSETSSNENFILTDEPLSSESRIQLSAFGWLLKKLLIDCDEKKVYLPLNSFIFYYLLNGDVLFKKEPLHLKTLSLILSKFLREYDFDLDNRIMNLNNYKNDEELQSIMEETFMDVLSKSEKPFIMENIQLIIISKLYSYFYSDLKIEKLKLIKEGFDWFNLNHFKQVAVLLSSNDSNESNNLEEFFDLQGSNFVEQDLSVNELKILLSGQSYIDSDLLLNEINFCHVSETMKDFLTKCIRKLTKSQLRQLLVWMTALSSIPIRGFSRKITIREQTRFEAHTCSFSFDIPSQISNFEEFETLFMNCLRLSSVATMEDFNDTTGNTLEN